MDQFSKNRPLNLDDVKNMSDDELANALYAMTPPTPTPVVDTPVVSEPVPTAPATRAKRFQSISESSPLPRTPMTDDNSRSRLYQYLQERMNKDYVPGLRDMNDVQKGVSDTNTGLGIIEAGATIGKALAGGGPQGPATTQAQQASKDQLASYLSQRQMERNAQYDQLAAAKELSDIEQAKEKARLDAERARADDEWKRRMYNFAVEKANSPTDKDFKPEVFGEGEKGEPLVLKGDKLYTVNNKTGQFDIPYVGRPKRTGIADSQDKVIREVKQDADKKLKDLSDVEDNVARAESLLNTNDPNIIPTVATMMATAIQKGVLTDRDFANGSGQPVQWFNQGSDFLKTRLLGMKPDEQIKTMKTILNTTKTFANQKREVTKQIFNDRLTSKGINVPESTWYTPSTVTTPSQTGTSPLQPKDQQALEWANANPNDPRAAKIKQRLGR